MNPRKHGGKVKQFNPLPAWLRFVPAITGGDDPVDPPAGEAPKPGDENNFGSEAIGELLSRLDKKDANYAKVAAELAAAQDLLREQENARLSAEQKATRDALAEKRALEKRAADAETAAAEGNKAIEYAKAVGIKYAIEHLTDKDGKPKYVWADVATVYELLNHDDITFDFSKGEATGLEAQLDELAAKRPFLLGNPQVTPGNQPPPAYGQPPAGAGNGAPGVKTPADYADKYPAMAKIAGRQRPGYAIQSPATR
jgi:hypothetical protein